YVYLMTSSSFSSSRPPHHLHSSPTRRSSDLKAFKRRTSVPSPAGQFAGKLPVDLSRHPPAASGGRGRGSAITPLKSEQPHAGKRSEEHTSELQSLAYLVCRLLLEKKNK